MRGQKAETAVEYKDVNLRCLRGRLWRLSSILTCGVLAINLVACGGWRALLTCVGRKD